MIPHGDEKLAHVATADAARAATARKLRALALEYETGRSPLRLLYGLAPGVTIGPGAHRA